MEALSKGQRLPLAQLAPDGVLEIGAFAQGLTLDFACFGLDAAGKLSDDRYMTFFNQPRTPCGAVEAKSGTQGDGAAFAFQLARLPASIDRLVLTASIDGGGVMSQMQAGYLRLLAAGREFARFAFAGKDFAQEKAVMLGELYRKDGQWRFMAVGQGFNGGLDALVRHFGGEVDQSAPAAPSGAPAAVSAVAQAKINLEKRVEREAPQLVSLVKQAGV